MRRVGGPPGLQTIRSRFAERPRYRPHVATDPATLEFLLDQLDTRGARFTTRRMFGEACVYRDGRPVALVCDDVLYVKDTAAGRAVAASIAPLEFGPPYPGATPHLRLPPDLWDEGDALRRLLDATAAALPPPKARPGRIGEPEAPASRMRPVKRLPGGKSSPGTARVAPNGRAADDPAASRSLTRATPTRRPPTRKPRD